MNEGRRTIPSVATQFPQKEKLRSINKTHIVHIICLNTIRGYICTAHMRAGSGTPPHPLQLRKQQNAGANIAPAPCDAIRRQPALHPNTHIHTHVLLPIHQRVTGWGKESILTQTSLRNFIHLSPVRSRIRLPHRKARVFERYSQTLRYDTLVSLWRIFNSWCQSRHRSL